MRRSVLVIATVVFPFLAVAGPALPKGFASQRFAPIGTIATLPPAVRRAVDRYIRSEPLRDAGAFIGAGGACVPLPGRRLVFAGLGRELDFVLYEHVEVGKTPAHDHLLVFERDTSRKRNLVFSCTGTLPRHPAKLKTALLRGECVEASGAAETF